MPWTSRWVDIEPSRSQLDPPRVDIVRVEPSAAIERKPEPTVSPQVKLLALISIGMALTLATIEFLFRRTAAG